MKIMNILSGSKYSSEKELYGVIKQLGDQVWHINGYSNFKILGSEIRTEKFYPGSKGASYGIIDFVIVAKNENNKHQLFLAEVKYDCTDPGIIGQGLRYYLSTRKFNKDIKLNSLIQKKLKIDKEQSSALISESKFIFLDQWANLENYETIKYLTNLQKEVDFLYCIFAHNSNGTVELCSPDDFNCIIDLISYAKSLNEDIEDLLISEQSLKKIIQDVETMVSKNKNLNKFGRTDQQRKYRRIKIKQGKRSYKIEIWSEITRIWIFMRDFDSNDMMHSEGRNWNGRDSNHSLANEIIIIINNMEID